MFGWVSRCWGGLGVNTQFERARIRSVIADWKVPETTDICVLINSFRGQNPEIQPQTALNVFFSHMEVDDERGDPIFLLKHLYILDQSVEERTVLDKIAAYHNSDFLAYKTSSNIQITPIRELIAAYFMYIKKKAEIYSQIDNSYFVAKEARSEVVEGCAIAQIFILVDRCLDIQRLISSINTIYKGRNKSVALIQEIFTMLLKTYLFCYTLVSTSARVLFRRMQSLSKSEAVRMFKFILFFNKDYTRNFVDFIESNKEILIYRSIKYSELILIEKSYIEVLERYIRNADCRPANLPNNIVDMDQQRQLLQLPDDVFSKLTEQIRITYQPRKLLKLQKSGQVEELFNSYSNLYSDVYESEFQASLRRHYNLEQDRQVLKGGSDSKLIRLRKVEYQSSSTSTKFSEPLWNDWNNVYSS